MAGTVTTHKQRSVRFKICPHFNVLALKCITFTCKWLKRTRILFYFYLLLEFFLVFIFLLVASTSQGNDDAYPCSASERKTKTSSRSPSHIYIIHYKVFIADNRQLFALFFLHITRSRAIDVRVFAASSAAVDGSWNSWRFEFSLKKYQIIIYPMCLFQEKLCRFFFSLPRSLLSKNSAASISLWMLINCTAFIISFIFKIWSCIYKVQK